MSKFKQIAWVIVGVSIVYVMLAIFIKFLADTTVSVNQQLAATSNMAQYQGTSGFLLASPWILYMAPACLGIIAIVVILKRRA